MKKTIVMLMLCRRVIADLLISVIEKQGGVEAFGEYIYKNAVTTAISRKPDIALVEIPEQYGNPADDTFIVSEGIKEASPGCKIVMLCPEKDKASVNACTEAKKAGKIEDFLFYDSSVDYLVSKLEALYPD
jgi:DNA-binding NarL/FixJ family response regulator